MNVSLSKSASASDNPAPSPSCADVAAPRLLVSVRNVEEAEQAIAGGVDLLDIKEPSRGSLGLADAQTIAGIRDGVARLSADLPVSVACGEVTDWLDGTQTLRDEMPGALESHVDNALRHPIRYFKLGLAGLAREPNWPVLWQQVRTRVEGTGENATGAGWIAVAYLDAAECGAPPFPDVIRCAVDTGCAGLLFDTFFKRHPRPPLPLGDGIARDVETVRQAGLLCALAGQIGPEDLPGLIPLGVDIVAVRSAVCTGTNRQNNLEASAVRRFKQALLRAGERRSVTVSE